MEFVSGVHLVDARFVDALRAAGAEAGWSTAPIPVLDRKGTPITGHRLLIVRGRVTKEGFKDVARAGTVDGATARDGAPGALPARAGLAAAPGDLPAALLASPAVGSALSDAGLRGLVLKEERWIVPLRT